MTESAKEVVWGGEGEVRGMLGRQSEYIKTHLDSLCASLSVSPFITSVDALKTLQSFIILISSTHTIC